MEREIYTIMSTPFAIARQFRHIKTKVTEYEVIEVAGFSLILVKNFIKNVWHCAEETSGAIVGTNKSKSNLIRQVKNDIESGEKEVMEKQIEEGKRHCEQAALWQTDSFFASFK